MLDRIEGRAGATDTPIGCVPTPSSLMLDGLSISRGTLDELLSVNPSDWTEEERCVDEFFAKFGEDLPEAIRKEQKALAERLLAVSSR
jgi:phosphoenolpyruvate carboxykinase (GTP)